MEAEPAAEHGSLDSVEWDTDDPQGTGQLKFALIRFEDLFGSDPGQIPAGANILSATLTYVVYNEGDPADVNEVSIPWLENVTYDGFGGTSGVQNDDYGASRGTASGLPVGVYNVDVRASLAAWSADPSANSGWIFRPTGTNGVDFRSSEYGVTSERPKLTVVYSTSSVVYFEDFGDTAGEDPADWVDTEANNSLDEDDSLFETFDVDGEIAFGTVSTSTNIHSHYTGAVYDTSPTGFVFTGRMRLSASNGGIGVTFLSGYPDTTSYYRVRRYGSNAFHLSPLGTSVSGVTDSGVVPVADTWYLYKVEVVDTGSRTEIRAKVWAQGSAEPGAWQIDAWDESGSRLTSGRIGVWSMGGGGKYWDDLMVEMMGPVNQPPVADGTVAPLSGPWPLDVDFDGSASYDPDAPDDSIVFYEWDFEGDGVYDWSGDDTTSGITSYTYGASGAYNATLRVTDNGGATGTQSVTVTVSDPDEPASIDVDPASITVNEGAAATFTVAASGTEPLRYQWQQENSGVWEDIAGATGSSYTLSEALYPDDDGAMFRCEVSNDVPSPGTPTVVYSNSATLTVTELDYAYFEDFGDTAGEDPADWVDTEANNSLDEDDSLFETFDVDGEIAFGTVSTSTNIHSHYTGAVYDTSPTGFVFTGRMRLSASNGGIGVTFLSGYPDTTSYYRVRRYGSNAFHLSPLGTSVSGVTDSGVVPVADTWYLYKVEVVDTGSRTEIRAKVWAQGSAEPGAWQIDAWDESGSRLTSGRIGVWSMGGGGKYWDDLMIYDLTPQP